MFSAGHPAAVRAGFTPCEDLSGCSRWPRVWCPAAGRSAKQTPACWARSDGRRIDQVGEPLPRTKRQTNTCVLGAERRPEDRSARRATAAGRSAKQTPACWARSDGRRTDQVGERGTKRQTNTCVLGAERRPEDRSARRATAAGRSAKQNLRAGRGATAGGQIR